MNVDYAPKPPVASVDEDIIFKGEVIGWVKEYTDCRDRNKFHAGIHINVGDLFPALIQGHGDTKNEAIDIAIQKGKDFALALLKGIVELEEKDKGGRS